MEFERLTFQVYKHCLDSFRDSGGGTSSRSCWVLTWAMIGAGVFALIGLVDLHSQFVGSSSCLTNSLLEQGILTSSLNSKGLMHEDQFMNLFVQRRTNEPNVMLPSKYQFSFNASILALSESVQRSHHFESIDVNLTSSCFGSFMTKYLMSDAGYDTVLFNSLMFTFNQAGIFGNPEGEYFTWTDKDITPYQTSLQWSNWKLNMVVTSLLTFFLSSSICGLILRAYLSSIIYAVYPLYWIAGLSDEVYSRDNPLLGAQISIIRAHNRPVAPFIIAHITRIILFMVILVAAQYSISVWFYRPSGSPGHPELFIFILVLMVEGLSLVFIRARLSIQVFPRVFALFFLLFHFYYYCFPSGFHYQALSVAFYFTLALFFFCMAEFETKVCYRRIINRNHTRMLFNSLPWRSTVNDVSPDYTTFMPLTNYARPTTTLFDILSRALFFPGALNNAGGGVGDADSGSETGSGSFFSEGSAATGSLNNDADNSTREIEMSTPPLQAPSPRNYGSMEYSSVPTVDEYGVPYSGLEHV